MLGVHVLLLAAVGPIQELEHAKEEQTHLTVLLVVVPVIPHRLSLVRVCRSVAIGLTGAPGAAVLLLVVPEVIREPDSARLQGDPFVVELALGMEVSPPAAHLSHNV